MSHKTIIRISAPRKSNDQKTVPAILFEIGDNSALIDASIPSLALDELENKKPKTTDRTLIILNILYFPTKIINYLNLTMIINKAQHNFLLI